MKKIKRKIMAKISLIAVVVIIAINLSFAIYAATIEKTTLEFKDEKMYLGMYNALKDYVLENDRANFIIKIATEDIPKITEINLENYGITNISGLEKLTNLTKINLANNNLTNISSLSILNNIQEINLNGNEELGNNANEILSNKTNLTNLEMANVGLTNISFLTNLKKLKILNVSGGSFNEANEIGRLTSLEDLDVSGNKSIRELKPLLNLKSLKKLNISSTSITKLEWDISDYEQTGIYALSNLKELKLSHLNLENAYPLVKTEYIENYRKNENGDWEGEDAAKLEKLEVLDISYINTNDNIYIPSFYELSKFINLKILNIEGNHLRDVNEIYKLNKLEEVNLKENDIYNLNGFVDIETYYDDNGNERQNLKSWISAKKINLSNNHLGLEKEGMKAFEWLYNYNKEQNIDVLDLSDNNIYDTRYLEKVGGNLYLYNQKVNMNVHKKNINVDQYIFLYPILSSIRDKNSILYSKEAKFELTGCEINSNIEYQTPNTLNIIISHTKTYEDEVKILVTGNKQQVITSGTEVTYTISDDSESIDSIVFNDANLNSAISQELRKNEYISHFVSAKDILNVNRFAITDTTKLNLSEKNITDITGLENFSNLIELNLSKNKNITSIEKIKECNQMEIFNASETAIGNNFSAIENWENLRSLLLNSVGMTKITNLNNLTQKKVKQEQECTIEELDLSANSLDNLNGIENIKSLRILTATKNNISQLPNLSELKNLEQISLFNNKLAKIPKIDKTEKKLKYIYLSENKINDISELNGLTELIALDLSNNYLEDNDIKNIQNIKISKALKLAGNSIKDPSYLSKYMRSIEELDLSKNMIDNVSILEEERNKGGKVLAKEQRLAIILESTDENEISIDLPQIFTAVKRTGGYFYTPADFDVKNCTVTGDENTGFKMNINIKEMGKDVATATIIGGQAGNTMVTVAPPISAQIIYSTEEWTKENVTATINFLNRENVTIKNNDGQNKYIFDKNGEFTFEFVDEYGMQGTMKAEVNWIDKEKPVITGIENEKTYYTSVTPLISDNQKISQIVLKKNGQVVAGYTSEKEIKDFGNYELTAKDHVGNETKISFNIKEEEKITSDIYEINEQKKIITKVSPKTTLTDFKKALKGTIKIYKENKEITDENKKIGTGMKVIIQRGPEKVEYKIIVTGDLNGDGEMGDIDVLKLARYKAGLDTNLEGEYLIASNIIKDDKYADDTDLLKMVRVLVGLDSL